jgi:hypothetical protein
LGSELREYRNAAGWLLATVGSVNGKICCGAPEYSRAGKCPGLGRLSGDSGNVFAAEELQRGMRAGEMKDTAGSENLTPFERLAVSVDRAPLDIVYRVAIGFFIAPLSGLLWAGQDWGWRPPLLLFGILLALRVVPVVARKLIPFSATVQEIWRNRRQLAKRYDSFQWRKLFWIGIGLGLHLAISGHVTTSRMVLVSVCLLSGAAGQARWRAVLRGMELNKATPGTSSRPGPSCSQGD